MNNRRKAEVFAAFIALSVMVAAVHSAGVGPSPPQDKPEDAPWRKIVKVMDGDTLRLSDPDEIVRLVGVDAPESSANKKLKRDLEKMRVEVDKAEMTALGIDAALFARMTAEGRQCWLEYDSKKVDLYGRTLAYVHLDDGRILNEVIIESGYGRTYLDYPFRYKARYLILQREAMENNRGLWAYRSDSGLLNSEKEK